MVMGSLVQLLFLGSRMEPDFGQGNYKRRDFFRAIPGLRQLAGKCQTVTAGKYP